MSIEMKAAIQTLKFVGSIAVAAGLMVFLSSVFGPEIVSWFLIVSLLICGSWVIYSITLSSLKFKEKDDARRAE